MKPSKTIPIVLAALLLLGTVVGVLLLTEVGASFMGKSSADDTAMRIAPPAQDSSTSTQTARRTMSLTGGEIVARSDADADENDNSGTTKPAVDDPTKAENSRGKKSDDADLESTKRDAKKSEAPKIPKLTGLPIVDAGTLRLNPREELAKRFGGRRNNPQTSQGKKPRTNEIAQPADGSVPLLSQAANLKHGLYGEYYSHSTSVQELLITGQDPSAGSPTHTRIDSTINFADRAAFNLPFDSEHWLVHWEGFLKVEKDRELILAFGTDLAGAVSINGQLVLLNTAFHWYTENYAVIQIPAGFHRLVVEHIEGPSPRDKNRNTACRLMYKPKWGDEVNPLPLPADWLYQPESISATSPVIESLSPTEIDVDDELTILGRGFVAGAGEEADLISGTGAFTGKAGGVEVFIDGLPTEVVDANDTQLKVKIPAGAASGEVEVRRRGVPSNRLPLAITTQFGLIVSAWDLRGSAIDFVDPEVRAPDLVMLDPDPFPLTLEKFSQLGPGPIAVRVEGMYAGWQIKDRTVRKKSDATGLEYYVSNRWGFWFNTNSPMNQISYTTVLGQSSTRKLDVGYAAYDGPNVYTSTSGFDHELEDIPNPGPEHVVGSQHPVYQHGGWLDLKLEVVLLPMEMQEVHKDGERYAAQISLSLLTPGSRPDTTFYKPSFKLPPPPKLTAYPGQTGAKVGEEVAVYVDQKSWADKTNKLSFSVDGVPTSFQPGIVQSNGSVIVDPMVQLNSSGQPEAFIPVRVLIPDLAGEGKIRARSGLVQSDALQINVQDRGLIAYYYDFDTPLLACPDVSSMQPVLARTDKKIDFENNAAFQLTFPPERFSVEWFGGLRIPVSGEWTFIIQSDDGFRLKLNDGIVSEFTGLRPPGESTAKITLSEGWHDLHLEFYENDVNENIVIWWIPPGSTTREKLPTKHLRTTRLRGVPVKTPLVQQ